MQYLTGCIPSKPELQTNLLNAGIGALLTPYSQRNTPNDHWTWAADNACFNNKWEHHKWFTWLESKQNPDTALFATIPDVVANHHETLKRWEQHWKSVADMGYKTAFVIQDGATLDTIPIEQMDALFIGGTTEYKLSTEAQHIVEYCKTKGKWIHMGRVNSRRRIELAHNWGCDSVDGTYLAFSPDANTPRLIRMVQAGTQPKLF